MDSVAFLNNTLNPLLVQIECELRQKLLNRTALDGKFEFDRTRTIACEMDSHMRFLGVEYSSFQTMAAWRMFKKRSEWERMRMLAAITVQPYVKGKVTPFQLMRFPWDDHAGEAGEPEKPLTREERRARALEALRKWG